jgi:hypothetical protein
VYNTGGKEQGDVGGKKGYIYSSSGGSRFKVQLVSFVGYGTQNGAAFILHHHQAPYEREASR